MSSVPRARPTMYRGVQYRSRLEATWAAFFDLGGIKALYEYREDLAGYIPDFELVFRKGPVLAEVKPATSPADFEDAVEKINASGYRGYALLLGADPTVAQVCLFPLRVPPNPNSRYEGLWNCRLPVWWGTCSYCAAHDSASSPIWPYVNSYSAGGDHLPCCKDRSGPPWGPPLRKTPSGKHVEMAVCSDARDQWARAQNATQWRAPR